MDLFLNLPDDLIEHIYTFWNPYKPSYRNVLSELQGQYFWFKFFLFFFPRQDTLFYKYVLKRNKKL